MSKLPKEYSFKHMAKSFGINNIILSWDLIPALIISLFIGYFYIPDLVTTTDNLVIVMALIGANAGLMGIVLAGFSIFLAFMDEKFLPILRRTKMYEESIFMFTYSSILISTALMLSILFPFMLNIYTDAAIVVFMLTLFFTFYGLLSVVLLFFQVKNIAIAKGRYIAMKEGQLTPKDF